MLDHWANNRFTAEHRKLPCQDLERICASRHYGSFAQWVRFRRPARFAWSSCFAVAVVAGTFGTNLLQATPVRAAEERRPVTTSAEPFNTVSQPAALSARAAFHESKRAGKPAKAAEQFNSLGLRYSFVIRGSDGQEKEVDAATAVQSPGQVRISVEVSQDAYLQILQNLGSAGTRLWWPQQETGKISLKVTAGKRNEIPLPPSAEGGLLSLTIRLSQKPFAPLTMQEVAMLDRFSADLLIESVSPDGPTGSQEQATYAVSQAATPAAQIAVEIPFDR